MVTALNIDVEHGKVKGGDKDIVRIIFVGELDETNVEAAAEKIYRIIDEATAETVFFMDYAALGYMNSKSLGYLSDWYTKVTERGGKLIIVSPQPTIEDVLRTVGLEAFIPIVQNYDAAQEYVGVTGDVVSPAQNSVEQAKPQLETKKNTGKILK